MNLLKKTVRDIKKLKIQGATNVAKSAIKAIIYVSENSKTKTKNQFLKELDKARKELYKTRSTEPLMRNSLRYIIHQVEDSSVESILDLQKLVSIVSEETLKNIISNKDKVAYYISQKISDGDVVMTHCHSSTVTLGLTKAWKDGKKFSVICTETRPLFQGRKTAKELIDVGIPTTMIVDSAVSTFVKKATIVFVGCDMITAEIDALNKIGTLNLALGSKRVGVPFYVCTTLAKFDPETIYGKQGKIEQRNSDEIWKSKPKKLKIENPAFDITSRELITSFFTQNGIVSPGSFYDMITDKAPWILYGVQQ